MASNPNYCDVTPEIEALAAMSLENSCIDPEDYVRYDVKRGLRDLNGKGVVAGLTEISDIVAKKLVDGKEIPCDGKLYYRGVDVEELVSGALREGRFGFEETAYLLILGRLPNAAELEAFKRQLGYYRSLPNNFVRDVILKAPSHDIMNTLGGACLTWPPMMTGPTTSPCPTSCGSVSSCWRPFRCSAYTAIRPTTTRRAIPSLFTRPIRKSLPQRTF